VIDFRAASVAAESRLGRDGVLKLLRHQIRSSQPCMGRLAQHWSALARFVVRNTLAPMLPAGTCADFGQNRQRDHDQMGKEFQVQVESPERRS
jgi:hypothetical protein